jgi:iron-sulfur cluster repair protein YtfE (RIC family)
VHFREEEEILLPTLARFSELDQPIVARVLLDHVRIRRLADDVGGDVELDPLHALGTELEQHVRREERELFPLIEQSLPEPELVALSERLAG